MSRGMTIAEFVQQVYYAIYKVRLDVNQDVDGAFHSKTDKFKEVVMEGNFVLNIMQKDQDWNFKRVRVVLGCAKNPCNGIAEYTIPEGIYKPATGFNDAIRLRYSPTQFIEVPWTSPRSGNHTDYAMFDQFANRDVPDNRLLAFQVGDTITFNRPFLPQELGMQVETDMIELFEPLHICDANCPDNCPKAYEDKVFQDIPDPYYMVLATAARRALGDPSASDMSQPLQDDANKMMSAMRENDSSRTTTDFYQTNSFGYVSVL